MRQQPPIRSTGIAIVVVIAMCFGARADAQSPADIKRSNAAVKDGDAHYAKRDFGPARDAYLRAYAISRQPMLLYNIAQTYRYQNKQADALTYYARFLATAPPNPRLQTSAATRARARDFVKRLKAELANAAAKSSAASAAESTKATTKSPRDKPAVAEAPPKPPAVKVPIAPAPVAQPTNVSAAAGPELSPDAVVSTDAPRRRSWKRRAAWISLGVGAGSLVAAGVFGTLGLSAESDHRADPLGGHGSRVERYQTLTNVSLLAAGAATVTGLVFYMISRRGTSEAQSSAVSAFGIMPTAGGAQAALTIDF